MTRPLKSFIPTLEKMIAKSEKALAEMKDAQKREALNRAKQWIAQKK